MMRLGKSSVGAGLVLTASMLSAFPAAAQQRAWRASSSSGEQAAFIDTGSIQRDGDKVRFWREIRSAAPITFSTGERVDRIGSRMEVDCRARTLVNLEVYAKFGDQLIGEGPGDGSVEPIAEGSTADIDLRAVCFNDWPR